MADQDGSKGRRNDAGGAPRRIESPADAFRVMAEDLAKGDAASAVVIGDHLVRFDAGNRDRVRALYAEAVDGGLDHGLLHQRLWEIDRDRGAYGEYFSAAGQDRFVAETFFKGAAAGVFADIGAHDGVTGSNTLYFERLGWRGVCVEASPTQFEKLTAARSVPCVNAAVADFDGEARFLEITKGFDQMSVLSDAMRPTFLDDLETMSARTPSESREITVPVRTFAAVCAEHGLGAIDYCSIDVEGAELAVLRGIDFAATPIGVLSVENPPHQAETFAAVREFLTGRGYRLAASLGDDDIFAIES